MAFQPPDKGKGTPGQHVGAVGDGSGDGTFGDQNHFILKVSGGLMDLPGHGVHIEGTDKRHMGVWH